MKTVSLQGKQLSKGQLRDLEFRKKVEQSFLSPVLEQQVQQTLNAVQERKDKAAKPEKVWTTIFQEFGTPSFAEWMGY